MTYLQYVDWWSIKTNWFSYNIKSLNFKTSHVVFQTIFANQWIEFPSLVNTFECKVRGFHLIRKMENTTQLRFLETKLIVVYCTSLLRRKSLNISTVHHANRTDGDVWALRHLVLNFASEFSTCTQDTQQGCEHCCLRFHCSCTRMQNHTTLHFPLAY